MDSDERRRIFSLMPSTGDFTCQCEHSSEGVDLSGEGAWVWTPENKPRGWELYDFLGKPKTIVAPMVDQSELSFRILCKRYGADLTYSPMINSNCFVKEHAQQYREREFTTCPADTNMVLQFCGNNPETIVEAARYVEKSGCKAIDLNLGCPQGIARKGHYGAFLMEEIPLVCDMIRALDTNISVPITAKIRKFNDPLHTIDYAKRLAAAGATMLGVHGRLREAKGSVPGDADWEIIKMVREALPDIPVFANGNVWSHEDVSLALEHTGCAGVMSADSLLWEPRLFSYPVCSMASGRHFQVEDIRARISAIETCLEYLEICTTHPTQPGQMKSHIFKMTHHSLQVHTEVRQFISDASSDKTGSMVDTFTALVQDLLEREQRLLATSPQEAVSTRDDYLKRVVHLGNVDVPSRHIMAHKCSPPDMESEYRRKKDAPVEDMLDDVPPMYDLFEA
eukprot:TRINITY_DN2916_c3_g1_i1.p1 TRINITY_DN2916_c3_g1~~TRINITY_DN2916_c3_g1_i1.p1  ORF type:complete len:478 (+),score=203.74 TRINITY_DN2916_c3_g1_i1:80-1435(+)